MAFLDALDLARVSRPHGCKFGFLRNLAKTNSENRAVQRLCQLNKQGSQITFLNLLRGFYIGKEKLTQNLQKILNQRPHKNLGRDQNTSRSTKIDKPFIFTTIILTNCLTN